MRHALLLFWMLVLLSFHSTNVLASEIARHEVKISLDENGIASVTAEVDYKDLTTADVPYFVLGRAYDVKAKDEEQELVCLTLEQPYGTYISCKPPSKNMKNYTVYFTFKLKGLVSFSQNFNRFIYSYGIKEPTDRFILKLYLPEGYGLLKTTEEQLVPYSPENARIGSDGRHVIVEWDIGQPDLGSTLSFSVLYEYVGEKPYSMMYYIPPLIILAVVIVFVRLRKSRDVLSVLTPDERIVVDVIRKKGGKNIKQRDIVRMTNFSKAKVSRILATLEKRGIVKRERVGRTNKVRLSRKI